MTATATTASIIQHTHAHVTAQRPQSGTHKKIQTSTSVANPIGKHLKKSELVLSVIMTLQTSGETFVSTVRVDVVL